MQIIISNLTQLSYSVSIATAGNWQNDNKCLCLYIVMGRWGSLALQTEDQGSKPHRYNMWSLECHWNKLTVNVWRLGPKQTSIARAVPRFFKSRYLIQLSLSHFETTLHGVLLVWHSNKISGFFNNDISGMSVLDWLHRSYSQVYVVQTRCVLLPVRRTSL